MNLSPERLARYRATAAMRHDEETRLAFERREIALRAAHKAAAMLKRRFDASRVYAFGSVLRKESFTPWSDLDIAAWGITGQNWLTAAAAARELSDLVEVNLVDVETCGDGLRRTILRDGIEL
jgi:predicted nucleotidyltransferase